MAPHQEPSLSVEQLRPIFWLIRVLLMTVCALVIVGAQSWLTGALALVALLPTAYGEYLTRERE